MRLFNKNKQILNHQDYLISERQTQKIKIEPETFSEYLDDQILKIKEKESYNKKIPLEILD